LPPPIKIDKIFSGYSQWLKKIHRPFFNLDSTKDILAALFITQLFFWQIKVYNGQVFVL
jgi:hypothetical protein